MQLFWVPQILKKISDIRCQMSDYDFNNGNKISDIRFQISDYDYNNGDKTSDFRFQTKTVFTLSWQFLISDV
jgi:hypothetical protein